MDYDAIVAALAREGVSAGGGRRAARRVARPGAARRAVRSRRLHRASRHRAQRYLAFVLDELGVRSAATVAALSAWRRTYNLPNGLWTVLEPDAEAALRLARRRGLATAVISNSNGTIAEILDASASAATSTSSSTPRGSASKSPTPASSTSRSSRARAAPRPSRLRRRPLLHRRPRRPRRRPPRRVDGPRALLAATGLPDRSARPRRRRAAARRHRHASECADVVRNLGAGG